MSISSAYTVHKFWIRGTRYDRLVFCHNGNPFTRSDVENITGIGNSNKTQEANKIGRFGIGFKSVFAITDRPEIYTLIEGYRFAFAIEHLVVPVTISEKYEQNDSYDTQFVFPFMKGQEAFLSSKIKERLSMLGFEALLFLQHLTSIEWQIEGVLCKLSGTLSKLCRRVPKCLSDK